MGVLVNGEWKDQWYDTKSTGGRFVRKDAAFRNWITADGSAGATGDAGFKAEKDRYHLFVSYACPWAHRALVFRELKDLTDIVPVTAVEPLMLENGWTFAQIEPLTGANYAWQVYTKADPTYSGRATVPILWDKHQNTIVSNESSEIIRMFNEAFNDVTGNTRDFYPAALRQDIDEINARVYDTVNNGVYKSGFATTKEAYEEAVVGVFKTLDMIEERLATQRYLVGDTLTDADWRLFTTLIRFDAVYVGHFKCNIRRIEDYPNLSNYLRELFQMPGISRTVDMPTIKQHYYGSHETINPTRIVPVGPALDFGRHHDRTRLKAAA
ncbi:putative glutathione S-transferase [Roseibium hamelinense]|uniref:Putative glutathione S-transferase n=1 Tax=Roseibium hamelinense TaxID=150831 RepID=A0A562SXP0_9HYPH|nr:glutathione S-transferase family protein [Roseibium hamelinense]MTI43584.1 glutathione S-transferase family protein [Roseibium hamelinense]TWI86099.1 putative glutathione S-transferase [Roseibium hamelinense]